MHCADKICSVPIAKQGAALRIRAKRSIKPTGWFRALLSRTRGLGDRGSGARSYARSSIFVLTAVFALLMLGSASASANEIHVVKNSFGAGELSVGTNSGIAVNRESGVLYVGDTGHERVLTYEVSGTPLGSLGTFAAPTFVAVDNSLGGNGDIYVVETGGTENTISKVTPAGALLTGWAAGGHLGGLGRIAGVAIDGSGHLWVLNAAGELRSYAPAFATGEEPTSKCMLAEGASPTGISVDGAGRVYVTRAEEQLQAVNSSCVPQTNELGESIGPAADLSDESVFFATNGRLNHAKVVAGRFETIEKNIGRSVTNEGISSEEGEGSAGAGQLAVDPAGDPAGGGLFAVVPGRGKVFDFGLENVEPPSLEGPAVSDVTGTSAKFTAHIDPHRPPGANALPYVVSYEVECTPGCPGGSGTEPGDATNHLVEFEATGLAPGTKYKVELIAGNMGGRAIAPEASSPPVEFTTGAVAPSVGEISIVRVAESEAFVEALVNPGGAETTYQVEYVTLAQYEASQFEGALKSAPGVLTVGSHAELVPVTLTGLSPGTRYKLRAVAGNAVEVGVHGPPAELRTQESVPPAAGCPNAAFQLLAGAFLSDCRAYEQSTPLDKNGGSAAGLVRFVQASETGSAISFYSEAGFPGGVGSQDFSPFVASRGTTSWSTRGALPPQALGEKAGVIGLTGDDRDSISQVNRGDQTALVYRDLETDEAKFIVPYRPACSHIRGSEACFAYAGSSIDGTKVFFETYLPVTEPPVEPPATEPEAQNLYMWNAETGQVVLVGQNASDEPLAEGSIGGPYEWLEEQTLTGGSLASFYTGAIHAISEDGDQAVFTEAGTDQLFARVGLDGDSPSTIHVSESQNEDISQSENEEQEELPAAFLEATPEGEFIFFKSYGKLTADAGTGESGGSWNLYRYDVKTGELLDLTPGSLDEEPGGEDLGPGVRGLIGASSDGQVAYFVARGELVPGASAREEHLYRFDANRTPPLTLVATLESASPEEGDATVWDPHSQSSSQSFSKTGRVSGNGEVVVFGSEKPLTAYDNRGAHCGTSSGRCVEFYRWSTATETPECLTCDATGALPIGSASLASPIFNAVIAPGLESAPMLTRNLSGDGTRFFFQTPDPLSARDINADQGCAFEEGIATGIATCMDVYEWEAVGTGSCHAAVVAGGCVSLLSPGDSEEASYFGDADREGDNAFIFTSSRLVPVDRDRLYDVYDVAMNGGLPSQWEEPLSPCTSAESCGGQRAQPGAGATAGSENFVGPGNEKPMPKKKCHKDAKKCKNKHHKKKHHKKKQKKNAHGSHSVDAGTKNLGGEK